MRKLSKKMFGIVFCTLLLICAVFLIGNTKVSYEVIKPYNVPTYNTSNNGTEEVKQMVFLSDIPYSTGKVGWGNIALDKTQTNTPLTLKMNGVATVFQKGIWAHATSTLEYDISAYNKDYTYLTTYYGINTAANNAGNGAKFYIYTSKDGQNWNLKTEENPTAMKVVDNARYAKVDISDANYVRLYVSDNGSNASDNSIWADTKLVKSDYEENIMPTVKAFDEIIKEAYTSGAIEEDLRLTLLQRDFINRVGQYTLRTFVEENDKNKEMIEWFLNDEEALRLWTIGGAPSGTYQRALQVLSDLYSTHKEDLINENETENGTKYKDLYLKMMLSLSLTHSANVGLWIGGNQFSDAVTRYEIYKQMHLDKKLESNAMFESYTIQEMRGVMQTNIDDEEILWLRDYSAKRYPDRIQRFNPYKYINYTLSYGYYRPQYYSQENYAKWDKKYNLSAYNITYQAGKPKLWIVFEEGAVCGGLSKTAANLYGVWGYPARVVGQPGHAAYIYLYNAGGGKYAWQLSNSVASTGWANTGGSAVNGWGTKYATNSNGIQSGSYILLAQDAQNEYEKYEKSELILLLKDVYRNDREKLEQIYRDALKEERINLDAWIGLVDLYITDNTKKDEDLIKLAEEISEVYTYHPLPMYDLTRRIATKLTSAEYKSKMMMLQNETLNKATKATGANTIYVKEVPVIANAILGVVDTKIATFSYNGANAGKIVLSKQLQSTQVTWEYSLDGGQKWKECYESFAQLTDEEIASINVNNDIKIHIIGLPKTDANIYTIDITKRTFPSGLISINDEEDRMLNTTNDMEWTLDPANGWNSFANTNPIFSGNVRVYVRVVAAGTQIASDPVYYTFTENNTDDEKWYIQSKNLQVIEVNGTGAGKWNNILDGNTNTYWRSAPNMFPAYIKIKLDQPRYISGLDYVPDQSFKHFIGAVCGIAKKLNIYVSMDGSNWELAASKDNLADDISLKHIDFPEAKKALYVKVECEKINPPPSNSSSKYNLFAVSIIKLYENILVTDIPRAEVNYNIVGTTNKDVTAELINPIRPITVTNNGGKTTHTFTENGEFTFEFVDNYGNKGSSTAKVDWIDKTPPKANVSFSTTEITNEEVVATLDFDKPNVTILSEDVQVSENPVDKSKTITFEDNATYELKFADALGNIGTKTIAVDWIDKEAPTADFIYNTMHLTDKPVTVQLDPSEEITVTNNGGKDTYTFTKNGEFTFEFVDRAGNRGTATAIVNWIARVPKYTLTYSTKEWTTENVTVTLDLEEGYTLVSDFGNNVYTFTENGEYSFEYVDENGNRGSILAKVSWIDREDPTGRIEYSTTSKTNKSVTATLVPSEEVTITNNNGNKTYTFTENGEFTFTFKDRVGHEGTATATVNWIDKVKPNAILSYDITEKTETDVTVTITFDKENVTITNNSGKNTYTFTKNGKFTFEFVDEAGNINSATAEVIWIEKKEPEIPPEGIISTEYKVEEGYISRIIPGTTIKEFKNNVQTHQTLVFKNKKGETITDENTILTTDTIVNVGNLEFALSVIGDVDGNYNAELGELITLTDLAQLKLHYIESNQVTLSKASIKAADINGDGEITLTDLAKIKLVLIGEIVIGK